MINDLMNNRLCSVRFLEPELQSSDKRVDHGPLTRPILTDTGVAAYRASLHYVSRWIGSGLPTIQELSPRVRAKRRAANALLKAQSIGHPGGVYWIRGAPPTYAPTVL